MTIPDEYRVTNEEQEVGVVFIPDRRYRVDPRYKLADTGIARWFKLLTAGGVVPLVSAIVFGLIMMWSDIEHLKTVMIERRAATVATEAELEDLRDHVASVESVALKARHDGAMKVNTAEQRVKHLENALSLLRVEVRALAQTVAKLSK